MTRAQHVQPRPLIAVRDVAASSRWYCELLNCASGHGGPAYEQIVDGERVVLQLHRWNGGDDDHPNLDPGPGRVGRGLLLWFQLDALDAAAARATRLGATIVEALHTNPDAGQRELWLRDPDGYHVVLAGR